METHDTQFIEGEEWISVYQYSKRIGKSKAQIYLDIRTGKMPKERVRKQNITVNRIQIKVN